MAFKSCLQQIGNSHTYCIITTMLCTLIDAKVQKSLKKRKTAIRFTSTSYTQLSKKQELLLQPEILLSVHIELVESLAMTTKTLVEKTLSMSMYSV